VGVDLSQIKPVGRCALLLCFCSWLTAPLWPQKFSKVDRDLAGAMLRNVAADVQKNYYDPKLHGLDWDAKVRQTKENINKADSTDAAISEIAALLDSLNDSHTRLILPPRSYKHSYGFKAQMIGEHCYVTYVRPGSDAGKKGLKPGDEILAINEHPVSRKNFWRIEYIYKTLRPQPGFRLTLPGDGGTPRQMDVMAKIEPSSVIKLGLNQGANELGREIEKEGIASEPRYFEKKDDLLVVKMPQFILSAEEVDSVLSRMRKHKGVVLDLRGNPGGAIITLDRFLGGMFEYDRKICDRVTRTSTKPVTVTGRHHDAFTGRLAVLVDSKSSSASEIFARVIQLERRGFVVGDRTSGMVMESERFVHESSVDWLVGFGVSVTEADMVMTDGKSLEHVGVEPDIVVLPTSEDLANHRDPAMAKAASLVGGKLSPEEAGAAFPEKDSEDY
jgi:carboxyl-terminal processing protease